MNAPSFRMYVDENGNYNLREDLSNDSNRFLCLSGVVMQSSAHNTLDSELSNLKLRYFCSKEVILHRRELVSGKPPFEALKDTDTRNSYNADLLQIMTDIDYLVISILIDKKALVDKYTIIKAHDPYALALEYLMQRYLYWLQCNSKQGIVVTGDILAESRGGREDRITKETYKLIHSGKGYNRLKGAHKYFSSKEIKLKKKKENIAGLQFVDLISHPARRYILSENGLAHNIKPTSFEKDIVDVLIKDKFRRSDNGIIEGYGTVFFPK